MFVCLFLLVMSFDDIQLQDVVHLALAETFASDTSASFRHLVGKCNKQNYMKLMASHLLKHSVQWVWAVRKHVPKWGGKNLAALPIQNHRILRRAHSPSSSCLRKHTTAMHSTHKRQGAFSRQRSLPTLPILKACEVRILEILKCFMDLLHIWWEEYPKKNQQPRGTTTNPTKS